MHTDCIFVVWTSIFTPDAVGLHWVAIPAQSRHMDKATCLVSCVPGSHHCIAMVCGQQWRCWEKWLFVVLLFISTERQEAIRCQEPNNFGSPLRLTQSHPVDSVQGAAWVKGPSFLFTLWLSSGAACFSKYKSGSWCYKYFLPQGVSAFMTKACGWGEMHRRVWLGRR